MAYTTINKSSDFFNTKLYTGNGSTNAITGVGFQPDMTWLKIRTQSYSHRIYDAVRGVTKYVHPDTTEVEYTTATSLTAFNSDGFTLGSNAGDNKSGDTFVSWNWKANGQGSSNTDGSINTTYTSVNTTAGFSICSYTGTGANATIGHGLGSVPKMIITKKLNSTENWKTYHASLGNDKKVQLDTSDASSSFSGWNDTTPTSSLIYFSDNAGVNGSGDTYIAYCFAEKTGYSKFGSYVGNGNADGTFIYTGFKPAFVLFKGSTIAENWWMFDTKRSESNVANDGLIASTNNSEYSNSATFKIDILSNGFKIRDSDSFANSSGNTYIYMCFAEAPLVGSNNVPCTAR